VPSLRALERAGHRLELVVTQPDRPGHRLRLTPPPVKTAAQELGLAVFQPERVRAPDAIERLAKTEPELVVVVAYGQIIPPAILQLPSRGVLNVHASLLPRWRGAAPIAHAILAGDPLTGVTIMQMDEQLDHGPLLTARQTAIGDREDAAALAARLADLGADLLIDTLAGLDGLEPREQDHASATLAPKLSREDGVLDWQLDALEIDRRVRAFQPWPGVTLPFGEDRVKVLRGHPGKGSGAAGQVLGLEGDGVEVAAGRGSYFLEEVQPPGGRSLPARILVAKDG
jgi:methionyl-tRNA formyltransferase